MRHCKLCGKTGHNSRTCGRNRNAESGAENGALRVNSDQPESVVVSNPVVGTAFLKPKKGLWVVNPDRQRIAGKVLYVKGNGNFVYEELHGAHIESTVQRILDAKYIFVDLTPRMLRWLEKR